MNSYIRKAKGQLGRRPGHFEPASQAQKDIYLKHVKAGDGAGMARKAAGLTWEVFKHALASDPAFRQAQEDIDEFFLDKLEDVARSMANNRDGAMVRWILEKRRPEVYGQKSKVEVSHRFESPEQIRGMSDEDILAAFEELGVEVKQ